MNIATLPAEFHADACFINTGDAMRDSGILDGDAVFVELGAAFGDGDIVVVEVEGGTLLRHIWCRDDGGVLLNAANGKYPALSFEGWERIKYIGRAVCINRRLNVRAG